MSQTELEAIESELTRQIDRVGLYGYALDKPAQLELFQYLLDELHDYDMDTVVSLQEDVGDLEETVKDLERKLADLKKENEELHRKVQPHARRGKAPKVFPPNIFLIRPSEKPWGGDSA